MRNLILQLVAELKLKSVNWMTTVYHYDIENETGLP